MGIYQLNYTKGKQEGLHYMIKVARGGRIWIKINQITNKNSAVPQKMWMMRSKRKQQIFQTSMKCNEGCQLI